VHLIGSASGRFGAVYKKEINQKENGIVASEHCFHLGGVQRISRHGRDQYA
jgi:hypothetical protein